jgi:hypothetical protein
MKKTEGRKSRATVPLSTAKLKTSHAEKYTISNNLSCMWIKFFQGKFEQKLHANKNFTQLVKRWNLNAEPDPAM